jgi:type 1 fimbriae regulatory protein FimB
MIVLAYKHGLRASEVCNLRLGDVDLKNGNIVVERLKGSLRTGQAVTEHRGEPLLNELKALREWLRHRGHDRSDFLFVSQKGGRLHRSQFFRLFRSVAAMAGLPPEKRHPHALMHSIASHLLSANVNLALVKQQLGHKSIVSTMRYVAATDQGKTIESSHQDPVFLLAYAGVCTQLHKPTLLTNETLGAMGIDRHDGPHR